MNVLAIDTNPERRRLIGEALSWFDDEHNFFEAEGLGSTEEIIRTVDLRLVIVGPELPEETLAALVYLRGRLPHSNLLASTRMSVFERDAQTRLLDSGADLVFDYRMSATQLALLLRPYLGRPAIQVEPANAFEFPAIRHSGADLIAA